VKHLNNEQANLWESYTESIATKRNLHSAKQTFKAALDHDPKLPNDELLSLHKYIEMMERLVDGDKIVAASESNPKIAAKRSRIKSMLNRLLKRG